MIQQFPKSIPAIPMVRILRQYATAHRLPFDMRRWEEIVRCYHHYSEHAKKLN